jgi:hypothetical protein
MVQYSFLGRTAASILLNTTFRGLAPSPSSGKNCAPEKTILNHVAAKVLKLIYVRTAKCAVEEHSGSGSNLLTQHSNLLRREAVSMGKYFQHFEELNCFHLLGQSSSS